MLLHHSNGKFSKLDLLLGKNLDDFHMLAGEGRLQAADQGRIKGQLKYDCTHVQMKRKIRK